jgi:hypothetical protein
MTCWWQTLVVECALTHPSNFQTRITHIASPLSLPAQLQMDTVFDRFVEHINKHHQAIISSLAHVNAAGINASNRILSEVIQACSENMKFYGLTMEEIRKLTSKLGATDEG